jgi:hypothetical protein
VLEILTQDVKPVLAWAVGTGLTLFAAIGIIVSLISSHSSVRLLEAAVVSCLLVIGGLFRHILGLRSKLHIKAAAPAWAIAVEQGKRGPVGLLSADYEPEIREWLAKRREQLLKPLLEYEEVQRVKSSSAGGDLFAQLAGIQLDVFQQRETRTPNEFRQEVDVYIEKCRKAIPLIAQQQLAGTTLLLTEIEIVNLQHQNVAGVRLELTVPESLVVAVDGSQKKLTLPKPPQAWGPRPVDSISLAALSGLSVYPDRLQALKPSLGPEIRRGGDRTTIVFDSVHLRPGDRVKLPGVSLARIVDSPDVELTPLTTTWRATATDHDGHLEGEIQLAFEKFASTWKLFEMSQTRR